MDKDNKAANRILLPLYASIFMILIFGGLLLFSFLNEKRITNQNKNLLTEVSERVKKNIVTDLKNGSLNIENLSDILGHTLSSPEVDVTYFQTLFSSSIFDFIEFADLEGNDHNITGNVSDAHDRLYYLDAMKGNSGMELINKSRVTKETLFMFYSPVYFKDKIIGSLVGVYQAKNRLKYLLSTEFYGEKADCYVCTKDGRIIGTSTALDTSEEFYIQKILGKTDKIQKKIDDALLNENMTYFGDGNNVVGSIIKKLDNFDYYLVMTFPQNVNVKQIDDSDMHIHFLILYLLILFIVLVIILLFEFLRKNKEIEAANKAKSIFLLNMSHDIRTPMNAIIGFTSLASKNIDNKEKVLEYHNKINSASENLLSLINNVLDMSRIESGKTIIETQDYDLESILKELVTVFQTQCENKQIQFIFDAEEIENSFVKIDKTHFNQIILNLLGNAYKYTPENGKVSFIVRKLQNDADKMVFSFSVKDTGIGISKEFIKKLYEPFEREKSSVVNKIQGSGIGLSITKTLVDLMNGTISVESSPGFGSEFKVVIPFEKAKENFALETGNTETEQFDLKGKKVLVADDNPFNLEITSEILEEQGCVVVQVENGNEAVNTLKKSVPGEFDLVLMDIQMPVMNGLEASKVIRNFDSALSMIPIIAVTANVFKEDVERSRDAGINAFICKPVKVKELVQTMNKIISGHREL